MKGNIQSNDYSQLAEKGWNDLSARLDRELPVTVKPAQSFPFRKTAVVLALLFGVLLLTFMLTQQKTRAPFQSVPKIINHITFDVQQPDIVVSLLDPSASISATLLTEKKQTLQTDNIRTNSVVFRKKVIFSDTKESSGLQDENIGKISKLPSPVSTINYNGQSVITQSQAQVKLQKAAPSERHTRLGFNLNSTTHGLFQSESVGGGVSVSFPIGKRFSVEPGVGYDMMRFKEMKNHLALESEFSLARAVMATPSLNVKYRVRKSIAMPLSIHYQPIRQFALTGGVDVGLLISQQMVFENENSYKGFDTHKKQLNEGELNQLNRVNIGAHGGVSWFPTDGWKLGLYYGQNLTTEKKLKQKKAKLYNHIFKIRMARYF